MSFEQLALERDRYGRSLLKREQAAIEALATGKAHQLGADKLVSEDYLLPLAAKLAEHMMERKRGPQMLALRLLAGLDPEVSIYCCIRTAVDHCLSTEAVELRALAARVGKLVYWEWLMQQAKELDDKMAYRLIEELGRRRSKNEQHRAGMMQSIFSHRGRKLTPWPIGGPDAVGMYLLDLIRQAGMIEVLENPRKRGKSATYGVFLAGDTLPYLLERSRLVGALRPFVGPLIAPPLQWSGMEGGGFHSREMHRGKARFLVSTKPSARDLIMRGGMGMAVPAVNVVQKQAWGLDTEMMAVVQEVARLKLHGDVVAEDAVLPTPPRPEWLNRRNEPETDYEQQEFQQWKREMRDAYESRALFQSKQGRYIRAIGDAREMRGRGALYFAWFMDSRGRMYPHATGLNPQGNDLQRCLLRAHEGAPVQDDRAVLWLRVGGANRFGFDKARLVDRAGWVLDREAWIADIARDPSGTFGEWRDADKPLQFVAWCKEYTRWRADAKHPCRLPVSLDGSCNGLQHLSAMFRDPIGGEAVNLTPRQPMQDIYQRVADRCMERMQQETEEKYLPFVERWLRIGVTRKIAKYPCMSLPYGAVWGTCFDQMLDWLRDNPGHFQKGENAKAAAALTRHLWPAVGDVVIAGAAAMAWLKRAAGQFLATAPPDDPMLTWRTPSSFTAAQAYWAPTVTRVRTMMYGEVKIRVHSESDEPDYPKHTGSFPANFVHSLDAAHLHRVVLRAEQAGIPFLNIVHDDYGTLPAYTERLYSIVREEFVRMYEEFDPVQDLVSQIPNCPEPPARGTLDIRGVLESEYVFS